MLVDSVSQNGVSPGGFNLQRVPAICDQPESSGGAQVGANYEFVSTWVARRRSDRGPIRRISGNTLIGTTSAEPFAQERFTSQAEWFAALTGRVGYAANDWLFYAKAGGAWMNVKVHRRYSNSGGRYRRYPGHALIIAPVSPSGEMSASNSVWSKIYSRKDRV